MRGILNGLGSLDCDESTGGLHGSCRCRHEDTPAVLSCSRVPASVDMEGNKRRLRPVFLDIYNGRSAVFVKVVNAELAHWWAPVKLGGVFHVGVGIAGMEWLCDKTFKENRSGVYAPRQ